MTPLPPLVFIDLPLLSGATVSVRIDQIVSISDEAPRPADRGLPVRVPARRARVTTMGSREIVVAWSREEILSAIRAAAKLVRREVQSGGRIVSEVTMNTHPAVR